MLERPVPMQRAPLHFQPFAGTVPSTRLCMSTCRPCILCSSQKAGLTAHILTNCPALQYGSQARQRFALLGVWRRAFLTASVFTALSTQLPLLLVAAAEDNLPPAASIVNFEDKKKTYSLQRPKDWEQVEKAGADVLFKAPNLKSTDLGVTISPVRIKRLDQLGDVAAVGDRLLAAEKKKESTKSAELLQQDLRRGGSGTTFYEFDYTVSTTRGDKRILSAVGVANSNLYIVNGNIKCEGASCREETPIVDLVRQSIHSFDVAT